MSRRADQETLDALHRAVAKALLDRIESGEAKAADLSAAVKFLSDNSTQNVPTEDDSGLKEKLNDLLPFNAEPEIKDTID